MPEFVGVRLVLRPRSCSVSICGRSGAHRCGVLTAEALDQLALAVEWLFRSEARYQYPGWPTGATTDGSSIHVCWRSDDQEVQAVGLTCFDFGPNVFPFRLVVSGVGEGVHLDLFIGDTDVESGGPPMLASTASLVPIKGRDGRIVDVELIAGRRQTSISWTRAIERDGDGK